MKDLYKFLTAVSILVSASLFSQSTTSSYTQSLRFFNSDYLQIYQGARIAVPTMTLPNSLTTYTSTLGFGNSDLRQIYNAVRGMGDAVSGSTNTSWNITGNAIATNTNFIGTTSGRSLLFRTNNVTRAKIDSVGAIRIYSTNLLPSVNSTSALTVGSLFYDDQNKAGHTFFTNYPGFDGFAMTLRNGNTGIRFYLSNFGSSIAGRMQPYRKQGIAIVDSSGNNGIRIDDGGRVVIGNNSGTQTPVCYIEGGARVTTSIHVGAGTFGTSALHTARFSKGTGTVDIGEQTAGWSGIWFNQNVPSISNYNIISNGNDVYYNCAGSNYGYIGGSPITRLTNTGLRVGAGTIASATLDVTGTMSVSSTSTLTGLRNNGTFTNTTAMMVGGTTAGSATLHVLGTASVSGSSTLTGIRNNGTVSCTGNFSTTARVEFNQGAAVASTAGAMTLGGDGNVFEITGTNAITAIANTSWQNGSQITLYFTSTASLTDGTANSGANIGFELAGNVNFSATADDALTLVLCTVGGVQRWREKCRSIN